MARRRGESTLDDEERVLRSRVAAQALHAKHDPREITAAARAAGPNGMRYFEDKVDPDRLLEPAERRRRAEHKRKEYYARLAYRAARARNKNRAEE
jgi:hypothetical protein